MVRHRTGVDQSAPSVGHVQDGTGLGPGRSRRPPAEGPGRGRITGGRHVHYAHHTGRAHQLDGVHDRRESGRHDQEDVARIVV